MKRYVLAAITLSILLMLQGCAQAIIYDGTYRGRVIDAETREPIEGAVVLGTWYEEFATVAGANTKYYDARETVTSKDGEFSIPGQGLRFMSNLLPMSVLIFKSGYEYFESSWDSLKVAYSHKVQWEDDKVFFPLKKLTPAERAKSSEIPSRPDIPEDKMRNLTDEINKERIYHGFSPFDTKGTAR